MAVDVHDDDDLNEGDQGKPSCSVRVDQGEPVFAGAGREEYTDEEAEEATATLKLGK